MRAIQDRWRSGTWRRSAVGKRRQRRAAPALGQPRTVGMQLMPRPGAPGPVPAAWNTTAVPAPPQATRCSLAQKEASAMQALGRRVVTLRSPGSPRLPSQAGCRRPNCRGHVRLQFRVVKQGVASTLPDRAGTRPAQFTDTRFKMLQPLVPNPDRPRMLQADLDPAARPSQVRSADPRDRF